MDIDSLKTAINRSNIYLQKLPANKKFSLGSTSISTNTLMQTNNLLLQLIASAPSVKHLNNQIQEHFHIYQARGVSGFNPKKQMLVTGYYQPVFEGSLVKDEVYRFPLYSLPNNIVIRRAISQDDEDQGDGIGRFENGRFVPYWSRGEIEKNNLLAGQELVWLKDPMDAFSVHIQGSGLISFPDGQVRGVHYRMKNGRKYRSIGKYMVDQQYLTLENASMASIREYINKHPEKEEEIFHHNESFIFFEWTNTMGAIGSLGQELTGGRSVAVDKKIFPPGASAFLSTRVPVIEGGRVKKWKTANRFVTLQDTGSAIKGPGRVDLFWGSGFDAGLAAGRMKEDGQLFILIKK